MADLCYLSSTSTSSRPNLIRSRSMDDIASKSTASHIRSRQSMDDIASKLKASHSTKLPAKYFLFKSKSGVAETILTDHLHFIEQVEEDFAVMEGKFRSLLLKVRSSLIGELARTAAPRAARLSCRPLCANSARETSIELVPQSRAQNTENQLSYAETIKALLKRSQRTCRHLSKILTRFERPYFNKLVMTLV